MISASMDSAKHMLRRLLGDEAVGMIDYVRFPDRGDANFGPLNGQPFRQNLFRDMVERFRPVAIVETGTYRGTTTKFMAGLGLPVFSVEESLRNFGFARIRLWGHRNVKLFVGDSCDALCSWFNGPLRDMASRTLFFYLDAHWNEDLPLAEELDIVFRCCTQAVVMIDDFQVPHDKGYGYDDYGPGKALTPDYLTNAITEHGLCAFYPSTPSAQEGGWRRGCVVLAKNKVHGAALASLALLRSK
jgi:hypothetical protein